MDDNPSPMLQEAGAHKQSTIWEHLSTLCCRHRNPECSTWSSDFRHNNTLATVSETPIGKMHSRYSQYTVSPSFEAFVLMHTLSVGFEVGQNASFDYLWIMLSSCSNLVKDSAIVVLQDHNTWVWENVSWKPGVYNVLRSRVVYSVFRASWLKR